jgi:hypothetical protein
MLVLVTISTGGSLCVPLLSFHHGSSLFCIHPSSYPTLFDPSLLVVRQDLGADVGPGDARETSHEEPRGEPLPALTGLKHVRVVVTARERLGAHLGGLTLEGRGPVDGETPGEDEHEPGGSETPGHVGVGRVAERAELDEGAREQEPVGESDLDTTEGGGLGRTVGGEVGEEVGDDGGGRHGGLEHADEGIAINGGHGGLLRVRCGVRGVCGDIVLIRGRMGERANRGIKFSTVSLMYETCG